MIRYKINKDIRLFAIRCTGDVSLREWCSVVERMLAEHPEALEFDSIGDLRAKETVLSFDRVMELSRFSKGIGLQKHTRRSVALVASDVQFGVARMYEQLIEHESAVKRFTARSVADAAKWLGRPESLIRAELEELEEHATVHL